MTHCNTAMLASESVPIVGRATFTTVASRNAIPEPSTVASRTQRALGVPQVMESSTDIGAALKDLRSSSDSLAASLTAPRAWSSGGNI